MIRKLLFVLAALFAIAFMGNAQVPQQLNYQAIVRDVAVQPLPLGTNVKVRFTIHDLTSSGAIVFTEANTAITNQFGLITQIISGTGNLSAIQIIQYTGATEYVCSGCANLYSHFSGHKVY